MFSAAGAEGVGVWGSGGRRSRGHLQPARGGAAPVQVERSGHLYTQTAARSLVAIPVIIFIMQLYNSYYNYYY